MNRDSHVLLVEGMYKGKKGLKIEPPLYAHNDRWKLQVIEEEEMLE